MSPKCALGVVSRAASRLDGTPILPAQWAVGSGQKDRRPSKEKNRCDRMNEHPAAGVDGGAETGSRPKPCPGVSTAKPATRRAVTLLSRSTHPPPLSPPGTRPRRLPRTPAATNGTPTSVDEPAALNGRDRGNLFASGPVGGRSPASRQTLRGLCRVSPNTCWVQPPRVRRADTTARSPQQTAREIRPHS
jgi:hypothetical protein